MFSVGLIFSGLMFIGYCQKNKKSMGKDVKKGDIYIVGRNENW